MEEVIKYFESLEARIAALEEAQQTNEAVFASLEAEVEELKSRPAAEPQVVEKIVEKPVEVIKEVVVEKPVEVFINSASDSDTIFDNVAISSSVRRHVSTITLSNLPAQAFLI